MMPDQRRKEWCYYYSLSDLSRSRRVRLFTSRRPQSRTSSDLQLRFGFFPPVRAAAASNTVHLATLACLFVRGSVWRSPFLILSASSLGRRRLCVVATPAFAGRPRLRHTGVQLRLRDSLILADLLQRERVCIRPAQRWRSSKLRWRRLR